MDYRLLFKGDYISAVELGDKTPTLTVKGVDIAKLEGEDGRVRDRGVVRFAETDRGWVLCKTNAICLAAMFGNDTQEWTGKRVTLYGTEVQVGKGTAPGIRVKGSPDIAGPVDASIKLPKRRPFVMKLQKTQ